MESIDRQIQRTLNLLRATLRDRGLTQAEVQEALGWGNTYLSQLLTRRKELRVEQLLLVLAVVGVAPAEFFDDLYRRPPPLRTPPTPPDPALAPEAAVAPAVRRLLDRLRQRVEDAGLRHADLARRLGWSASSVSAVLRRRTVRLEQVLEILRALGASPSDFFAELFADDDEPVAAAGDPDAVRRDFRELRAILRGLLDVLVDHGVVSAAEAAALEDPERRKGPDIFNDRSLET